MSCHFVEPASLAEEKLCLPLTRGDDEDGRAWLGESLMYCQHRPDCGLACLPAAAEYLARVLGCQYLDLPLVGDDAHGHGELYGVGGHRRGRAARPRRLKPPQLPL